LLEAYDFKSAIRVYRGERMAMRPLSAFGWGCAGSFALEIVLFCHAVRQSKSNRIPSPYGRPAFIVGRALLVFVAGIVAAAWGITQPLQGLAVGAGAPQLMLSLTRFRFAAGAREEESEHSH
jgi:hypothetical protein